MGMSSTKTKSTQVTRPDVPSWIQGPQQTFAGNVNSLMGDWSKGVTGPTAQQQQAFGFRGTQLDQNPILNNVSKYMNPFEGAVVGNATRDMNDARQRQMANDQAAATAAGAFGGSRHGVADSLTNDAYYRNVGDMTSNLRFQGYNNAQQAALQDANYGLNAAGSTRADMGLMADLGEQERQLNARANPNSVESLQAMSGLLGYNPAMYVGNTTNTTSKTSGGGLGQVLGGLGTLAMGLGTGGLGWAPLAGIGAKSLGGAAGFTPGWGSGLFGNLK